MNILGGDQLVSAFVSPALPGLLDRFIGQVHALGPVFSDSPLRWVPGAVGTTVLDICVANAGHLSHEAVASAPMVA